MEKQHVCMWAQIEAYLLGSVVHCTASYSDLNDIGYGASPENISD